jgi:hypothetical protein
MDTTHYKLNEVNDSFIMIFEEVLNLLYHIYIKNRRLQCSRIIILLTSTCLLLIGRQVGS